MDIINIIIKNIKSRKLRGYLTILGIVIGVMTIVALMSLGDGLSNAVERQFSFLGSDVVIVFPAGLTGPPAGSNGFEENEIRFLDKVGGIKYKYNLIFQFGEITYKNQEYFGPINAFDMDRAERKFLDEGVDVITGRFYDNDESGVVVLGYKLAKEYFDEEIRVGNKVSIRERDFRVVGILEKTSGSLDDRVFMPADDLRDLYQTTIVNAVNFKAGEGRELNELKEDVENLMKKNFDEDEYDINTQEDLLKQVNQILGVVQGFLVAIAAISIIVGAVGIMNSMYTAVLERTKEIGIMKAVGATNSLIAIMFTLESGFLGFVGGLLGTAIGLGISYSVQVVAATLGFDFLIIQIDPVMIIEVLSGATILGMVFGVLPAYRAAKQQPVNALRYE